MTKNWGGVRKGAGRKKEENTKKTAVIRVDESLLPFIKILKDRHKAGQAVEISTDVTNNQDNDLQAKIKELTELVEFQNKKIYELNDKPLAQKNDELIKINNAFIVKYNKEHERADRLKKRNLDLVQQRDEANLKAVKLESKVSLLNADRKSLENSLKDYYAEKYTCMALKKDGSCCTRQAKTKINWHGVIINTCLQHNKTNSPE
jgi:hypothetical protein